MAAGEGGNRRSPAGEILLAEDCELPVALPATRAVVEILELQPAGKRRMSAAEFLRGHRLAARAIALARRQSRGLSADLYVPRCDGLIPVEYYMQLAFTSGTVHSAGRR